MFFLQQWNYKQYLDKLFLTYFRSVQSNSFFIKNPLVLQNLKQKKVVRRMSLWPPLRRICTKSVRAGVTLEAALVIPIFIFFVLNMFSVMEMLRLYGSMAFALNQVGGNVSLYGHVYEQNYEQWDMGVIGDVAFTYLYFKDELLRTMGKEYVNSSPLVNGENGLFFTKARIMEDDLVEVVVTYEMEIPFPIGAVKEIRTYNRYYGRAWTGYELKESEEEIVYVTETGTVYHTFADCSYLKLMIYKVDISEVGKQLNKEGVSFGLCELCGKGQSDVVWITKSGEKYHLSENCAAIKRTIYKVSLNEAKKKELERCSRCGDR